MKKILFLFAALILSFSAHAQNDPGFRIKGFVVDQDTKEFIVGATIDVPGAKGVGTATDSDGNFTFTLPEGKTQIRVSFVGYFAQNIPITASNDSLVIPLKPNKEMLKNVFSTGWPRSPNSRTPWPTYSRQGHSPEYRPDIFYPAEKYPLSAFSLDVTQNSYTTVRQKIEQGWNVIPTADIRSHEFINYFAYDYPAPHGQSLLRITHHYTDCPWNDGHRLLMIGFKAREIPQGGLPLSNLVFLIDNSGSMSNKNCLPLVVSALKALTARLQDTDRISIITYGGRSKIFLEGASGKEKEKISRILDGISPSYSYPGTDAVETAYKLAAAHFIPGGNNRVVVVSDGDFNIGKSTTEELEKFIKKKAKENIFLSFLGFGMNYKDDDMQALAKKAKGSYVYIDNAREAERIIIGQLIGPAFTLAKDVKVQVKFNPAAVAAYRLIGYEYRQTNENSHDELGEDGDLSMGQSMTAVYEIIPIGVKNPLLPSEGSLHQEETPEKAFMSTDAADIARLTIQYKTPEDSVSKKIETPIPNVTVPFGEAHPDIRFASAVIEFAQLISKNPNKGSFSLEHALSTAQNAKEDDPYEERAEFIQLLISYKSLFPETSPCLAN